MKRLIDRKIFFRMILQSLPIILVAVAFVIYGVSFLPVTAGQMVRSVALVESVSYYELRADGQMVLAFRSLSDGLLPEGLSLKADSSVISRSYASGFWVNRYPFIASCGGRLVIANSDSTAAKRAVMADRKLSAILNATTDSIAGLIEQLDKKAAETDYYMHVHNVNDDGYNVMAEYSASISMQKEKAGKLLVVLKSLSEKKRMEVRFITRYALITADTAGRASRTACNVITKRGTAPFCLLQTEDGAMPDGAHAVYLHQWLLPSLAPGDSIIAAAYPGCRSYKFRPEASRPALFTGAMRCNMRHDVPPLLAPDGALVFTQGGRLAGISIGGELTKPSAFGFGLKELLK